MLQMDSRFCVVGLELNWLSSSTFLVWKEISRNDAQLVDDGSKLLDVLNNVTERNEQLLQEQQKMKEKHEVEHETQQAQMVELEKENGLLRQKVEEKDSQITELELKIAAMEAAGPGTHFSSFMFFYFYFITVPAYKFCLITFSFDTLNAGINEILLCLGRRGNRNNCGRKWSEKGQGSTSKGKTEQDVVSVSLL